MQSFFIYLLEANIVLSVLFFLYKKLFYKETYFEWNRIYLISITLISIIIPLIEIPYELMSKVDYSISKSIEESDFRNSQNVFVNVLLQKQQTEEYLLLTVFFNIVKSVYFLFIAYFSFTFARNIYKILKLKTSNESYKNGNYTIIKTKKNPETFSFFRNIFLSNNFYALSQQEQNQVLEHEKIHAKHSHSLDVLFVEIVRIVFWFNPVVWHLKQVIKEVHEYIVDARIAAKNLPSQYSRLILKLSINNYQNVLASNFANNKIKDRILMLANKESKKLLQRKFLIGLPVLLFVILIFGFTKSIYLESGNEYTFSYKQLISPVPKNTKILTPFFENKQITKTETRKGERVNVKYQVSHTEITYNSYTNMPITAVAEGKIESIKKENNWGVSEYEITILHKNNFKSVYKKLSEIRIRENEKINKGDTLAIMGDNRIFRTIDIKLLKNGKPINPLKYYN